MSKKVLLDITAQRSDLLAALSSASRVANGKIQQALGSMCLECPGDSPVSWWATDYDIWRGGAIKIESATEPGIALLPVHQSAAMLKPCADGPVRLVFTEKDVHLTSGGLSARIPTCLIDGFPSRPIIPTSGIDLPAQRLARMIERVEPIILSNNTQYWQRGALLRIKDGEILCVSTSGHQIAKCSATFQQSGDDVHAIIPKKSLIELVSMLKDAKSARYASVDQKHIFIVDGEVLVTRGIDDKFPAWERLVPTSHQTRVVAKRVAWLDIVKRVIVASDVESRRVCLTTTKGRLSVSAQSLKGGEATEQFIVDQQGPDVECYININYLKHFLEMAPSGDVSWEIAGDMNPYVFRLEETAPEVGGADYLYVVAAMTRTGS